MCFARQNKAAVTTSNSLNNNYGRAIGDEHENNNNKNINKHIELVNFPTAKTVQGRDVKEVALFDSHIVETEAHYLNL